MGLIERLLTGLFGGGRNAIAETVGVFREGAEAGAQRRADYAHAALAQYASEFRHARRGGFDRFMDGLNRLPRPLMVLATFALFASAMFDPIWFSERMQGLALVPEPLWWLAATIVGFYFGGRFQSKSQEFRRIAGQTAEAAPEIVRNIAELGALRNHDTPGTADPGTDADLAKEALNAPDNAAVRAWADQNSTN